MTQASDIGEFHKKRVLVRVAPEASAPQLPAASLPRVQRLPSPPDRLLMSRTKRH